MKNILMTVAVAMMCFLNLFSQETSKEPTTNMKSPFFDIGYDFNGMSLGFGFRYWNVGLSLGVSGVGKYLPEHSRQYLSIPDANERFTYPSIWVTADAYYFYDLNDAFTVFGNIGYGVGTDSVLATKKGETNGSKYILGAENKSSITFGAGVQYFFPMQIGVGLGYHSKRGIYAQISYYWY